MPNLSRESVEKAVNIWKEFGFAIKSTIPTLAEAAQQWLLLTKPVEGGEVIEKRDGNWMDKWGACKVCDGEVPYGHTEDCDIYKMEVELTKLRTQLLALQQSKP